MRRSALCVAASTLLVALLLVSCGGTSDATPTQEPTPAPSTPTATPVATLPPTTTPTATPVATPSPTVTAPPGDPEVGKEVFRVEACAGCHGIKGLSAGGIGPNLDGLATRARTRVADLTAEEYVRQSIEDPEAFIAPDFPPFMPAQIRGDLTDQEFEDLVAFLLTLK